MKEFKNFIADITLKDLSLLLATFFVILVGAKFGQYIFFNWETSPAVLWPPTGIGLAILWLGGYRYALPIFLALVLSSFTGPLGYLVPAVVTTPLAQVFGISAAVFMLRRYNFDGTFETVRNISLFLSIIVVACMIAPTITTSISYATGNLSVEAYISWSRAWAGYIFSCLTLTPFILTWFQDEKNTIPNSVKESVFVGFLLITSVYLLFWTRIASDFSFIAFTIFFIAHFWVCYKFSTRIVTLSLLVTTVVGILGLFISPNPERDLNEQLFASELFLFLVLPIFYAFSALVKDRASTLNDLKKALSKIEKENVVKNNFISILAHELRNPLAPVKTTLEILEQIKLEPDIQKLIHGAQHQVHSMRRLLDDLLDVTRVTQGKFQLQMERSNLREMIDRSVALTESMFDRHQTFAILPSCDKSIWLNVDPVRFEQALVNILNNAAKYTGEGGRIEVGVMLQGKILEVRVQDNGIGIAPENLEDIFEAFWQARNSPVASGGGIGVGLSLTKHIIELHGGHLRAESEGKGYGSIFTITMPSFERDSNGLDAKKNSAANTGFYKILVVDDSHAAADSLAKLLTLKEHQAQTAYTGRQALELVPIFEPDVILLDIGLPDMTGYEVAEKFRASGYKGKIVALSGYGQKEDVEKATQAGCDFHFTKPMAIARFDEYLMTLKR